jgi:tetratricopeptide (TPR) repeat protein
LEKYTPAIGQFTRATEIDAARPQAWLNMAAAETALGHLDRARAILEELAGQHPRHPDLHYNLATLHLRRGELLQALAELELELAQNPRHRLAQGLVRELQQRK